MDRRASSSDLKRGAIILAGGEGKRLTALTQKIAGFPLPKQFCAVLGEMPLLEQTRRRVARCIHPDLIYFALNEQHQCFFTPILRNVSPQNMVVQPSNRGTAPAILYSLLRLAESGPDSSVLLIPSDHYVTDEAALTRYVRLAFEAVDTRPELTLILGVTADEPETAYGWIEPGATLNIRGCDIFEVRCFWEKPSPEIARELLTKGCLWNSFMIVGRLSTLLGLFVVATPGLYSEFWKLKPTFGTSFEGQAMRRLYERLQSADFSRQILESAATNLAVLPVPDIGWTDLGEPDRVIKAIASVGIRQKRGVVG
jgi:mannose-1-phosphate guanylyltransferase